MYIAMIVVYGKVYRVCMWKRLNGWHALQCSKASTMSAIGARSSVCWLNTWRRRIQIFRTGRHDGWRSIHVVWIFLAGGSASGGARLAGVLQGFNRFCHLLATFHAAQIKCSSVNQNVGKESVWNHAPEVARREKTLMVTQFQDGMSAAQMPWDAAGASCSKRTLSASAWSAVRTILVRHSKCELCWGHNVLLQVSKNCLETVVQTHP